MKKGFSKRNAAIAIVIVMAITLFTTVGCGDGGALARALQEEKAAKAEVANLREQNKALTEKLIRVENEAKSGQKCLDEAKAEKEAAEKAKKENCDTDEVKQCLAGKPDGLYAENHADTMAQFWKGCVVALDDWKGCAGKKELDAKKVSNGFSLAVSKWIAANQKEIAAAKGMEKVDLITDFIRGLKELSNKPPAWIQTQYSAGFTSAYNEWKKTESADLAGGICRAISPGHEGGLDEVDLPKHGLSQAKLKELGCTE